MLRVAKTREPLSVIGGVTADGRLFTHIRADAFTGETVVASLRQLLRQIRGKLVIVWDGARIHHGQAVKDFLARGAAARLQLERLPAYAPELNPAEGIWNMLERGERKHRCCQDLDELRWELGLAIRRLQRRRHRVRGCIAQCGYL